MAEQNPLDAFLERAVARGETLQSAERALLEAGWQERVVRRAAGRYVQSDFPVPVPRPHSYVSPRLLFLHLFYFGLLFVVAFNTIQLLFEIIDHYLPSALDDRGSVFSAVEGREHRMSKIHHRLALILVGMPVWLLVEQVIDRAQRNSGQTIPRLRVILMYLSYFIAAVVIVGSLVLLAYYLLRGELSARFFVKSGVLYLAVLWLYLYYRTELIVAEQES